MRNAVWSTWFGLVTAALMVTAPVSATEVLVWDQGEVVELAQLVVEKLDSLYVYGRQEQFEQERSSNRQLLDDMRRMRRLSRALASRLERGQDRDETMGVFLSLENVLRRGRQNLSTSSLFRGVENDLDAARQAMTQMRAFYYDADLEPPSVAAAPPPTLEQASPCWEEVRLAGVNFEFDSDKITADSASTLDAAAKELGGCEEVTIEIEGHTDSTGPEAYNIGLSDRRAASVKDHLVTAGIADDRISTRGHGPNQPIATNDTREGRALNRRVEIDPVQKD